MPAMLRASMTRFAGRSWPLALAALLAAFSLAPAAQAEPEWWAEEAEKAMEAAKAGNKPIVIYFETEKADDCVRMAQDTLPKISSGRFIWIRMRPDTHQKFFEYYNIFQTPQIVGLSPDGDEKGRILGFVAPDLLNPTLEEMLAASAPAPAPLPGVKATPTPSPKVIYPDGRIGTREDYENEIKQMKASQADAEKANYFLYEGFDAHNSLDQLVPLGFDPLIRHTMRVDPVAGRYNSPALYIGSDLKTGVQMSINPAVVMRIDLSKNLDKVQAARGSLRVRFKARVSKLPVDLTEVARLIIQKKEETPPPLLVTQRKLQNDDNRAVPIKLKMGQTQWIDKEAPSPEMDFRNEKAYLMLWVNNIGDSWVMDDLVVEIEGAERLVARVLPDPIRLTAPPDKTNSFLFTAADVNKDGKITRDEVAPSFQKLFDGYDLDGDGVIREGVKEVPKKQPPAPAMTPARR